VTTTAENRPNVEVLGTRHNRSAFDSGVEALNRYFRNQAGQDARRNLAAVFILTTPNGAIAGYYTLSATAIMLSVRPKTS